MLKNVKSEYILKIFFSYVDEKQKLKIVKYNKSLQKDIDISLINYILFSDKCLILEENGKAKEYDSTLEFLLYEGNYLHGERNGKGKEYNFYSKLIYEGEYLNGKRNGNGKEYCYNKALLVDKGELVFEGEYLNGKNVEWKNI